jgi:2-C-methyl-D-erythritol 4-phosphate cytidylyltransferase
MASATPKQYLPLAGRTVIEHALLPLLEHPALRRLVVALAPGDEVFPALAVAEDPRVQVTTGGTTRADSVAAGLAALQDLPPDTLVLVHDAARPCLDRAEINRLLEAVVGEDGALLALPVRDTLKRERGGGRVAGTVEREGLWQALTPQAFPLDTLTEALAGTRDGITDESSAIERTGAAPYLVEGDPCNIKVTRPGDLALAEAILAARHKEDT